jgi:hypothetical protein
MDRFKESLARRFDNVKSSLLAISWFSMLSRENLRLSADRKYAI